MTAGHRAEFLELHRSRYLTGRYSDDDALYNAVYASQHVDAQLARIMGALLGYPADALEAPPEADRRRTFGYWETQWPGTAEELYDAAAAVRANG